MSTQPAMTPNPQDKILPAVRETTELNVALCGHGRQGQELLEACFRIPGLRFRAVCDIWEHYRNWALGKLRVYRHKATGYEDYREMLDKEKDLDAVIVATPDWMHAEITNACLEAGQHVYCEKEMSNSLEKARSMVLTARRTGKLLQIGHQRRSNPRYLHAIHRLIHQTNLLGPVRHIYAQWNRGVPAKELENRKVPPPSPETLRRYGYGSLPELLEWRWYKKYGGGPIVDLGSHQIDLFSWVFGCNPSALLASGGVDYFTDREWYDNVLTIYEFNTAYGPARAFYQVLTTTRKGGFYEVFMGPEGSIQISEVVAQGNRAEREPLAPSWDMHVVRGLLESVHHPIRPGIARDPMLDIRASLPPEQYPLPIDLAKKAHQPHLENFFNAIRGREPLNCPAELAYETAVAVLKANDAVATGQRVTFTPEDFRV